jgi:hypothetical protein
MVESVCKFEESTMEPRVESCLNMQTNQTESLAVRLEDVEESLAELTVRTEEEADGRINEG